MEDQIISPIEEDEVEQNKQENKEIEEEIQKLIEKEENNLTNFEFMEVMKPLLSSNNKNNNPLPPPPKPLRTSLNRRNRSDRLTVSFFKSF
ncbi:unnamed protein product [Meloidogyne enterolobii]|uniref:Uncharacterized protein n=1 Tax=Meloidogyne enterolobii TaxID=390850 RepID=A0ACB0XLQ8_MELEN